LSFLPLLLFLHVIAVTVWVGGMFFAHQCLRPSAAQLLEPGPRVRLWRGVLGRFLPWVWACVVLIAGSGFSLFASAGFKGAPPAWHMMMGLGLLMMAIFAFVYFVPFAALRRCADAEDWPAGLAALARIRHLVGVNLTLGLVTIAIATLGRAMG
jgi:uncharacterized membrane protein